MEKLSLYDKLQKASSEEDIKDAYIEALNLTGVNKDLVDIRTEEIWFEAKHLPTSIYEMFTQLLFYVNEAQKTGKYIPPLLCVIDNEKAALMQTDKIFPLFKDKSIPWGKSASKCSKETIEKVSPYIGNHFVAYRIEDDEQAFIQAAKESIKSGGIIRINITPDNLKQVFDRWVAMIGSELPKDVAQTDYALLFYADIMHDGKTSTHQNLPASLLHKDEKPAFYLKGRMLELGSTKGYFDFWNIYHKPPEKEYRNYLLERRDSLIPLDERQFKGAYYTPLKVVDKAYDLLGKTLGKQWQKNYIVWDMCCGVGNLETKHSNHRNIFMSTLDAADIQVMQASKTCVAATHFQYDYLNDDISDDGTIDYSLSNKVPKELQEAIREGKKILVLINPPYGETGAGIGKGNLNKKGIEQSKINIQMDLGYASKELFVQFLTRIHKELPNATLAMFSTLKYVVAPNFEKFRASWQARYLGGFVVHSKAFDGINGDFPIGFLVWDTSKRQPIKSIKTQVLTKDSRLIMEKDFSNQSSSTFLNNWINKPVTNDNLALPLSNAISISKNPRLKKSCDEMIGYLYASNNDLQHAGQETLITSSIYTGGNGGGLYITANNLWQAAIVFAVRQLIAHTWINHNDQFLQPKTPLTDEFKNDCLIWMLFHGKNLTASANELEWNNQKWSIVNHFIPFSEDEVGANGRFESDFMRQYLSGKKLSKEAKQVMNEGRKLWQAYFCLTDEAKVREELKLNRPDVGWYQVRKALEARNTSGNGMPTDFGDLENAKKILSDKLRPMVFEFGFMK